MFTRQWAAEEDQELKRLVSKTPLELNDIAEELSRSETSTRKRIYDIFGSSSLKVVRYNLSKKIMPKQLDNQESTQLSDSEMVQILRSHGWEVTCQKYELIEL